MSKAPPSAFKAGDPRTAEAGRKGGLARAAQRRQEKGPYEGTILDMMDAAGLTGPSWAAWRVFLSRSDTEEGEGARFGVGEIGPSATSRSSARTGA